MSCDRPPRVLVWNEFLHEQTSGDPAASVYPNGIHATLAQALGDQGFDVTTATLGESWCGLSEDRLREMDVVVWWSHYAVERVSWAAAQRLRRNVLEGLGLVVLHSGHMARPFTLLMGTSCRLKWRESWALERIWTVDPSHPIAAGVPEHFELPAEEPYGEPLDVPPPDELVFVSWFAGGEAFRSGLCYRRGRGRIFYFRPGHEAFPTYYDANVQRVIANAVLWAAQPRPDPPFYGEWLPPYGRS
jgi:trehalose utilization protein